jgi:hypothetical protein
MGLYGCSVGNTLVAKISILRGELDPVGGSALLAPPLVNKACANILAARDLRYDRARRRDSRQYPRPILVAPLPTTLPPRNQSDLPMLCS